MSKKPEDLPGVDKEWADWRAAQRTRHPVQIKAARRPFKFRGTDVGEIRALFKIPEGKATTVSELMNGAEEWPFEDTIHAVRQRLGVWTGEPATKADQSFVDACRAYVKAAARGGRNLHRDSPLWDALAKLKYDAEFLLYFEQLFRYIWT